MQLTQTTINDLWDMLKPHMGQPAWPGIDDPMLAERGRELARQNGVWEFLDTLDAAHPIEVVRYSAYRSFKRGGLHIDDRTMMVAEVQKAATALWLDHPKASVDYLHDLLWAACETTTWVCSFHEYSGLLDLGSTTMAAQYAEILYMLGNRLEPEVVTRVRQQIRERVLDPGIDYKQTPWWTTVPMNWNLVCNTNLITAALYGIDDLFLAHYLHPVIQRLHYGLGGFAEDGGCFEGPGYWEYAFSHYLKAAVMLLHRTGGQLNLMDDPKADAICRFPLVGYIAGNQRMNFCDCGDGYLGSLTASMVNRFVSLPQLYAYLRPMDAPIDNKAMSNWNWREVATCPPADQQQATPDLHDYLLPDLRMAKARPAKNPQQAVLGVFAAHNDCPHNHNDVGSFLFHVNGLNMITDPGSPLYSGKVFGPARYEHPMTRTRGHSLPIVNGIEQRAGKEYCGTLSGEGLNSDGVKRVVAEIHHAYPDETLEKLERVFTLQPDGTLHLQDTFIFSAMPTAIEEGFATYEEAVVAKDGSVVIGPDGNTVTLCANTPGVFTVETWGPEADTWTTDRRLHRIAFTPATLATEMALGFTVTVNN